MTTVPFQHQQTNNFETLLVDYFLELDAGIPEDTIRSKILQLFLKEEQYGILHIAFACHNAHPIGFAIYQIDTPESDWCKYPGQGCIREFYIQPQYRRQGFGRMLAAWTQAHLQQLGARQLYLTADDAAPFWLACGFVHSHQLCSNDFEIMTKRLL